MKLWLYQSCIYYHCTDAEIKVVSKLRSPLFAKHRCIVAMQNWLIIIYGFVLWRLYYFGHFSFLHSAHRVFILCSSVVFFFSLHSYLLHVFLYISPLRCPLTSIFHVLIATSFSLVLLSICRSYLVSLLLVSHLCLPHLPLLLFLPSQSILFIPIIIIIPALSSQSHSGFLSAQGPRL